MVKLIMGPLTKLTLFYYSVMLHVPLDSIIESVIAVGGWRFSLFSVSSKCIRQQTINNDKTWRCTKAEL